MSEYHFYTDMVEPLSVAKVSYQVIQHATTNPYQNPSMKEEGDIFSEPIWAQIILQIPIIVLTFSFLIQNYH
jgi:hypothetical protein